MNSCVLLMWPVFFFGGIGVVVAALLIGDKIFDWMIDRCEWLLNALMVTLLVVCLTGLGFLSYQAAYDFCKGKTCPAAPAEVRK